MINPHTKYEVSIFTHYGDMKGNAKCRNVGGLGVMDHPRSPKCLPLTERIHFLFNTNRNYVSVLYRFRVIARYLSKVAHFNLPHLHLAPLG